MRYTNEQIEAALRAFTELGDYWLLTEFERSIIDHVMG